GGWRGSHRVPQGNGSLRRPETVSSAAVADAGSAYATRRRLPRAGVAQTRADNGSPAGRSFQFIEQGGGHAARAGVGGALVSGQTAFDGRIDGASRAIQEVLARGPE